MRIRLYGRAPFAEGAGLVHALAPREHLELDLRGLEFATPLDVAGLALIASCVGGGVTVLPPRSPEVLEYLTAMGLPAVVELPSSKRRPTRRIGFSIPVRRLTHPDEWDDTAGEILPDLHRHLGRTLANSVQMILGELADNAASHGSSKFGYYVAGQFYTGKTSGMPTGMWLAVVDAGVGIKEHLRSRPEYAVVRSDQQAIRLAFRPGVTGTVPPRGYGLLYVRQYAGLRAPGQVLIRSGSGVGVMFRRPDGGRTARYGRMRTRVPGTWVLVLVGGSR